jgi:hypothetical protein
MSSRAKEVYSNSSRAKQVDSNSPAGKRGSERVEVTSCLMTSNPWGGPKTTNKIITSNRCRKIDGSSSQILDQVTTRHFHHVGQNESIVVHSLVANECHWIWTQDNNTQRYGLVSSRRRTFCLVPLGGDHTQKRYQ